MAKAKLSELLNGELERQGETPQDISEIRMTENSGLSPSGCQKVAYEDLTVIEGDAGFGSESFPNLYAYTDDRVYFKRQYDGAEGIVSLPRNPTDESPRAFGGG